MLGRDHAAPAPHRNLGRQPRVDHGTLSRPGPVPIPCTGPDRYQVGIGRRQPALREDPAMRISKVLVAAKYRLGFDEFFLLQLGMQRRKRQWQNEAPGYAFAIDEAVLERFKKAVAEAVQKVRG